jgi:hypothetical protein
LRMYSLVKLETLENLLLQKFQGKKILIMDFLDSKFAFL